MIKLDNAQITTKCVEISKSMINTQVGLHTYDLITTRKIGDAARFAAAIRRTGTIESEKSIAAIGATLRLDFRAIHSDIIPMFEEFGWVDRVNDGRHIRKLDERIPPIEDVLDILGSEWIEEEPGKIESGTIYSLSEVSLKPTDKKSLISELELDTESFQPILDYGIHANYLGTFSSEETGNEFVWSPLYWNEKPEIILKYLKKQDDHRLSDLGYIAKDVVSEPGKPKETISNEKLDLIDTGIHFGFFSEVQICDRTGKSHQYVFPPSQYFALEPKNDIFEKARMIVACIRHGQYHAETTKILYPLSILSAMKTNSMKPHPYAAVQYFLLKQHGIIGIEPAETRYGKAYRVTWIDSPENNIAAEMAEQLLKGEEVYPTTSQEVDAKKILIEGLFNYSSEQRRIKTAKSISAKNEYSRIMEYALGVKV